MRRNLLIVTALCVLSATSGAVPTNPQRATSAPVLQQQDMTAPAVLQKHLVGWEEGVTRA